MDFQGLFAEMAKDPVFDQKAKERFAAFCAEKALPPSIVANHQVTWDAATKMGAEILAELIGETLEKHPYMAKQVMKMVGGEDAE